MKELARCEENIGLDAMTLHTSNGGQTTVLFDDLVGFTEDHDTIVITICPQRKNEGRKLATLTFHCADDVRNTFVRTLRAHAPEPGHFLVLVNPCSGSGHAESIWEKQAKPVFDAAKCTYEVIVTSKPADATKITKTHALAVKAIVIVSGDGLIFEAIQGMHTPVPLLHIPAGGGNALASSLLYSAGEKPGCLDSSLLMAVRGQEQPLDLFNVNISRNEDKQRADQMDGGSDNMASGEPDGFQSFLSVTWGIVADIDRESESMRWLGTFRFTAAGILRGVSVRTYTAEVYYRPPDAPQSGIPALSQPLPDDFVKLDMTSFLGVSIMNVPLLAADLIAYPKARVADGLLYIIAIGACGFTNALPILLGFEDGSYINNKLVHVIPCTAFRLVPQMRRGGNNMMVDGERMPCGPIQGSILPSAARVIAFSPT